MGGLIALNHQDRVVGLIDKYRAINLFPYETKDVGAFLFQEHPRYNSEDFNNKIYWREEIKRCVEGYWVEDSGTWVYMMPKLYWYINHGEIVITKRTAEGTSRRIRRPLLMHNEWVFQSAFMACSGFSGFAADEKYTCNYIIRDLHMGLNPPQQEVDFALTYGKTPGGDLKMYVDPWEYLTRFYLVDEPQGKPLGRAFYGNRTLNLVTVTARGTHKTFNISADCVHEFLCNGAKTLEEYKDPARIQLFTAAADSNFLHTFYETAYGIYDSMSGGKDLEPHPMYRSTSGPWTAERTEIKQVFQPKGSNEDKGTRSTIAKAIMIGEDMYKAISKRNNRIFVDEIGRIRNLRKAHSAFRNNLKDGDYWFGWVSYTGTGGDIEVTQDTEFMYTNPGLHDCLEIPNYWRDGRPIGLFMSHADTLTLFRDPQGNIDILKATQYAVDQRKLFEEKDGSDRAFDSLIDMIINQPLDPTEPFKISKVNVFDQERCANRISAVEEYVWDEKAEVIDLSISKEGVVTMRPIQDRMHNVIRNMDPRRSNIDVGEVVLLGNMPDKKDLDTEVKAIGGRFKIVYDPVSDKPDGPSYASIKVWDEVLQTIICTFKGRRSDPDGETMICLCMAVIWNAPVLYENQISGVVSLFNRYGRLEHLIYAPMELIKNVNPTSRKNMAPGVTMNDVLKLRGIRYLRTMINTPIARDNVGKDLTRVDLLDDLSFLYEMVFYGDGNFDDISAMLMLALWLKHEENYFFLEGGHDDDDEEAENEARELEEAAMQVDLDTY